MGQFHEVVLELISELLGLLNVMLLLLLLFLIQCIVKYCILISFIFLLDYCKIIFHSRDIYQGDHLWQRHMPIKLVSNFGVSETHPFLISQLRKLYETTFLTIIVFNGKCKNYLWFILIMFIDKNVPKNLYLYLLRMICYSLFTLFYECWS